MRTPTDSEIQAAAEKLGVVESGQPVPPHKRAKVARALQLAEVAERTDRAQATSDKTFTTAAASTYTGLIEAGLPDDAAARVVAAIAPQLWRTTQGAAHA